MKRVMKYWECQVCGYFYKQPEDKTPKPSFEKMPKDWKCPGCGSDKENFEKVDDFEVEE